MSRTGQFITRAPGVRFKDVHPTMTAGRQFKSEEYDPDVGTDKDFVRCKQCGFMVDRERDSKGSGYGNEVLGTAITGLDTDVVKYSPVVSGGCPFCGSSEYE